MRKLLVLIITILCVIQFCPVYAQTDSLTQVGGELENATITAYREKRGNNSFSYSVTDVKRIATVIGEPDVMRYMQILPGVSQGMEGGMGFYVRGAGNGNNKVELDGVPIMAPTHLFGLFSSFHTDIVGQSTFQMGGITASSGNLSSSLLKIDSKTPALDKYSGSFSISPLMFDGVLQGYVIKDRLSFQIAARTSLLRPEYMMLKKLIGDMDDTGDLNPQMQDVFAKLHWKLGPKHVIDVMGYCSHDYFSYIPEREIDESSVDVAFGWDNRVGSVKWIYTPSDAFRVETSAFYSYFKSADRQTEHTIENTNLGVFLAAQKTEKALKSQFFTKWKGISFNGGVDIRSQDHRPVMQKINLNVNQQNERKSIFKTAIASLYGEGEYVGETYRLKGGARYNCFLNEDNKAMHNAEIRLQGSYFVTKNAGLEATYDRLVQYQHTLEGLPVGWALDLVIPASPSYKPETSDQWYLGGFWGNKSIYATVGAYYKQMSNLTAYKSMLNQFSTRNISWEYDLVSGEGKSYGLEVWLEKRTGRLTGSIAYTLSKTTRHFEEINGGNSFPFKFDRPHNLNIQLQYMLSMSEHRESRINFATYFTSGNNTTIAESSYKAEELPYWDTRLGTVPSMEDYYARTRIGMSSVNGHRMPAYFRADAGYSILWKGKKVDNELTISVFNVMNRKNPYLMFYDEDGWKQMSVLPIVPSIRWEVRF